MKKASPTTASLFSVAMLAMLLGAVATSAVQSPPAALALTLPTEADPQVSAEVALPNFRDIARTSTPGVVNINTERAPRPANRGNDQPREFGNDFFERFFGPQGTVPRRPSARASSSTMRGTSSPTATWSRGPTRSR